MKRSFTDKVKSLFSNQSNKNLASTKYYSILYGPEYAKEDGPFAIVDNKNSDFDARLLEDEQRLTQETVNQLDLVMEGGEPADFQMTYEPWRLISEKMYKMLLSFKNDTFEFYPVKVKYGEKCLTMYIVHFLCKLDVLDERTIIDGSLMNAKISPSKLSICLNIFDYKQFNPCNVCISETVKTKLEETGVTGCHYEPLN